MSESTEIISKAKDVIDTMLGYLGFVVQVEEDNTHPGGGLHIFTKEAEVLIGKDGKRLEDIQYLINRIVHQHYPKAKRLRIDIEHYRSMQDDALVQRVQEHADKVRQTGRAIKLWAMNSYHRRLIHNTFKEDPMIDTWSPRDSAKVKRITLIRKKTDG
ncbi:MAG: single-stranded DNA-binding protein [Verrucomicrobiales bacterium]|jgi:spoIIIJ-associated protein|nr:single-stranded DNA-binding protein [Verrucomicrobiales bacterium]MDF1784512.1 single-stranded DNA-binding protein [Verrucomicrobiales bacterium]